MIRWLTVLPLGLVLGCTPSAPDAPITPTPDGPEQRRGASGLLRPTADQQEQLRTVCAATPEAPADGGFTGPMNDAHVHTAIENDQPAFAIALIEEMNRSGVQRALLQPDHAPGMLEHPGFMQAVRAMEVAWGDLAALCPRLVPLVYAFDPSDSASLPYVIERLDTGWYGGLGEIELQHVHLPIAHPPRSRSMEALYDLVDARRLLLHFQASPRLDPTLPDTVIAIAREHPGARFLWFACPQVDTRAWPPNLGCGELLHQGTPGVRESDRTVWGSDAAPAGFKNSSKGVLPYGDVAGAVVQAREALGAWDGEPRGLASERFDALVPTLPITATR